MSPKQVKAETFFVPPTSHSPNSHLPVIVYRNALEDKSVDGILQTVLIKDWVRGGHWKIDKERLAGMPHYHSNTHECYTVIAGTGTYLLGRSPLDAETDGVKFVAHEGDVFILPVRWPCPSGYTSILLTVQAGTTHQAVSTNGGYEIMGFYSKVRHSR